MHACSPVPCTEAFLTHTTNVVQVEQTQRELKEPSALSKQDEILWAVNTFGETLASVFVTPLPVLKFLDKLGFKELKLLSKSVRIMRESMLEMIYVRNPDRFNQFWVHRLPTHGMLYLVTSALLLCWIFVVGARLTVKEVVQQRRELMKNGEKTPDDLLGTLLTAVDPEDGTSLTDEELWEDVHDVMGAGHETTGTTTAALIYCVSTHPEVEEKLMGELKNVCGA